MPYIPLGERHRFSYRGEKITKAGELTFALWSVINNYLEAHNLSYQTLCEIEGALQCLSKEVYRRITVPYEDKKIMENGDVFTVSK